MKLIVATDPAGNWAETTIRVVFESMEEKLRQELEETRTELNSTRQDLERSEGELRLLINALSAAVVAALVVVAVGAGAVAFIFYLIFIRRGRVGPPGGL